MGKEFLKITVNTGSTEGYKSKLVHNKSFKTYKSKVRDRKGEIIKFTRVRFNNIFISTYQLQDYAYKNV